MERHDRAPVVSFFWGSAVAPGQVRVSGAPAQHARVRRVKPGDSVRLVDGLGHVASGQVESLDKEELFVVVDRVAEIPPPTALDVIVPVADRDRLLWAAEKCVELQVTSWRPAYFARSRSVSPRGEGSRFQDKVRARMQSALEQSGGAWMPQLHDEAEIIDAFGGVPSDRSRFVLDVSGDFLAGLAPTHGVALAIGPEGGIEARELAAARESGWVTASLGATTLRFETAVIAGVAVIRAAQFSRRSV